MEPDGRGLRVEFGAALRAAREARGLDTRAAATACRLSEDQVQGLEKNQSGSFYSEAYVARAARSYAAFLGVPLIGEYAQTPTMAPPAGPDAAVASTKPVTSTLRSRRSIRIALVLIATAVVAAVVLLLVVWKWEPRRGMVQAVPEAEPPGVRSPTAQSAAASLPHDDASLRQIAAPSPVTEPVPAPAPAPAPASAVHGRDDAAADARFFLQVFREVGLTAKDGNGRVLIHGRLSPLAGKRLTGSPPFSVVATDAEAIAVFYRGQRVRLVRDADGEWRAEFGAP
jgi:transcriptional regulator with XRE-family HTH domain